MSKPQPNFKKMNLDVLDAAESYGKGKNVPELVPPDKSDTTSTLDASQKSTTSNKSVPAKKATELTPTKRLAVFLPDYLVRAISDKAHSNNTTIRYVVTHALQKAGFQIQPQDLREDGRRER